MLVSRPVARDLNAVYRRKPFVEPSVSPPADALDATKVFAGQLGQVVLGGGSNGTRIDDGDYQSNSFYDSPYQDGVDSPSSCYDCL
jgi:hypothetical protein